MWCLAAEIVTAVWLLDLDNIRTEVGEQGGGERPCQDLPHVDDPEAGERTGTGLRMRSSPCTNGSGGRRSPHLVHAWVDHSRTPQMVNGARCVREARDD